MSELDHQTSSSSTIPLVSIITVNYNGLEDTRQLLDSLIQVIHSVSYEIIIVDNGSRVDEAAQLQAEFPSVIAIRSDKNLGFAGGNNLGIQVANGRYLFFINNDTFIREDHLDSLLEQFQTDASVAGISPKILFSEPPHRIQFAGYTDLTKITLRNRIVGINELDDGRWDNPAQTPFLHGCAMILKRSAIDAVGFMPEIYFLYYEELDWCKSFTRSGYRLLYVPTVVVYHKGSKSTGQDSPLKTYYMTRNRMLFAQRNTSGVQKYIAFTYLLFVVLPANLLKFITKGNVKAVKAIINGLFGFFMLLVKH
jgi:GT2 family glycosyltransferase